ncbi:MAG: CBS domain-containing protein [Gammaproteobacteria bacterium]|nr:CBS domain-containing protein [Gammaproteobacteria bacterium]
MNERIKDASASRSWFEKLGQALLTEPKDREQLLEMLRDSQQRNLFDADALAMIEGVFQVSEMQVRDIMVPRSQMVVVELENLSKQLLPVIIESAHSRFPVIGDNRDEILGILLAKDLLAMLVRDSETTFDMREILRPAVFVPESKRLNVLLREFRASRNHMAIVVDEYGGVAGLVTIEDVIEQIVGEIVDEHDFDEEDEYIKRHSDRQFTIKALTPIEDFNDYFGTRHSDEAFDTIGGLVMSAFGHLPCRGESVAVGGHRFKVLNADSRRIRLLEMYIEDGSSDLVEVAGES